MTSPIKALVCAAVAAAALAGGSAAPAAAAAPCWQKLLTDWYDGRIDHSYALHCYTDALKHLPTDVRTYSSAHDDILRALQSAKARLRKGHAGPNAIVPPSSGGGSPKSGGTGPGSGGGTTSTPTTTGETTGKGADTVPTTTSPGRRPDKGLGGVAQQLNGSDPSSVPVPLLVLGGLALLLVAAGAAGLIAKRVQARRPGP